MSKHTPRNPVYMTADDERLWKAAPDLLGALELILPLAIGYYGHAGNIESNGRYIAAARAAIKRATGDE